MGMVHSSVSSSPANTRITITSPAIRSRPVSSSLFARSLKVILLSPIVISTRPSRSAVSLSSTACSRGLLAQTPPTNLA